MALSGSRTGGRANRRQTSRRLPRGRASRRRPARCGARRSRAAPPRPIRPCRGAPLRKAAAISISCGGRALEQGGQQIDLLQAARSSAPRASEVSTSSANRIAVAIVAGLAALVECPRTRERTHEAACSRALGGPGCGRFGSMQQARESQPAGAAGRGMPVGEIGFNHPHGRRASERDQRNGVIRQHADGQRHAPSDRDQRRDRRGDADRRAHVQHGGDDSSRSA